MSSSYEFSSELGNYTPIGLQNDDVYLSAINAALNLVQQDLRQWASSTTALTSLESIFNVEDRSIAVAHLEDWADGIFTSILPNILVLSDENMSGTLGAYSAERDEIYISESLAKSDSITGLESVLAEEIGHAADALLNPNSDTAGDEGYLFSLSLQGLIDEADPSLIDALKVEDDTGWIVVDGVSVKVEQAAPTSLSFSTTKSAYELGETVSLTSAWVYDGDDYTDLDRVDFWLRKDGGTWQDIGDTSSFSPWASDSRWGSFDKMLTGLGEGSYELWGKAYDDSGDSSSAYTATFQVFDPNIAPTKLSFSTTKSAYNLDETVSLSSGWVYDADSYADLDRVDFWLRKDGGTWQDISDTSSFSPWASDSRWGSFDKMLTDLEEGSYELWGKAYDDSGKSSSAYTATFQVIPDTAPTDLKFTTTKSAYKVGETVSLSSGWVYDANGYEDLDRVDFQLRKDGGSWQDISDVFFFSPWASDSRWGSFDKMLTDLEEGSYELWGRAYDDAGMSSSSYTTSFTVTIPETYKPFDASKVFSLQSNAGANHTIYLDFDGHTTSGTDWNTYITNGNSFTTAAYDTDGFSGFSTLERLDIWDIWRRVSEDFMPFNVNVTTKAPALSDLIKSGSSDTHWGVRVVIGGSDQDWYKPENGAGGVAYLNSFNDSTDTPTYVFSEEFSSYANVAEAVSHEVGHTLGLEHDGKGSTEYYAGHGGFGTTSWAPIMGTGYYREVTQWSKGEYSGASNTEDDLAVITSRNGFGYRADDYGNSMGSASSLLTIGSTAQTYGIIERNTDRDWFVFNSTTGNISLDINSFEEGANLDVLVNLYNAAGSLLGTYNPINSLSASINDSFAAGTYYLSVEGTGKGTVDTGYSDYGSLGQYSITGSIG